MIVAHSEEASMTPHRQRVIMPQKELGDVTQDEAGEALGSWKSSRGSIGGGIPGVKMTTSSFTMTVV